MATNVKKGKKSAKKSGESTPTGDRREETPFEEVLETTEPEEDVAAEEIVPEELPPSPVYEEPVLVQLIVESYVGEKIKGLYEGDGEANFVGGHHFKGQFSEGMMHGQGKYTWADGLIYQGEFVKNHVMGKGTYMWSDGSSYIGEVIYGKRHGFGTFTSSDGQLCYTGEWCKGKTHGKGHMNYNCEGTSFYDGEWKDNVRHGWGIRQFPSGNIYQGMWFNNKRHGDGTMRWLNTNQMYTGQWEDGVQTGCGQHIWFLSRVAGSQYPMRNMYDGEFVQGMRHGLGTFYYANGARYEGAWQRNMKHGKGKFIFKNGRVYEGTFEHDHIIEFPSFAMDGVNTPDLTQIRTRTPLPSEHMSLVSNESRNTYGPSLQLDLDHLLEDFTDIDREEEISQVKFVVLRYTSSLRKIYAFYSQLGYEESPDNTFIMGRLQLWRFLKDCRLHHSGVTLMQMDRVMGSNWTAPEDLHNPYSKILLREFLNYLVILAFHIYRDKHEGSTPLLSFCLSKLISDNILHDACCLQGNIYIEPRRVTNLLVHMDQAYQVYCTFCTPRQHPPKEPSMKMRQFLHMLKDLKLLNDDLTAKAVVDILAADDPNVTDPDGAINLELEITFLEFFEALVVCAQVYVTEAVVNDPMTPGTSTGPARDPSLPVLAGSVSRADSQADAGISEGQQSVTPGDQTMGSRGSSPLAHVASDTTQRTATGKIPEQQLSSMTVGSQSEVTAAGTTADNTGKSAGSMGGARSALSVLSEASVGSDQPPLAQSMVSLDPADPAQDQSAQGEEEEEEEILDEATRQFNFWTHQVHIFFVVKFFPAAQRHSILRQLARQKIATEQIDSPAPKTPTNTHQENLADVPSNTKKTDLESQEIGVLA